MMPKKDTFRFVEDGRARAVNAAEPRIRAEVEAEYRERLTKAGWLGRLFLRREINRIVTQRLDAVAPPDALY